MPNILEYKHRLQHLDKRRGRLHSPPSKYEKYNSSTDMDGYLSTLVRMEESDDLWLELESCSSCHPTHPPPSQWQPLPPNVPTTYIVANMITAHQLQYSVQLLYHHLADPLGDLQAHIGLDHHLNDNHQPQIALLASSASIELVSSSARVTSAKFHKALGCMYTGTHRPDPRDT